MRRSIWESGLLLIALAMVGPGICGQAAAQTVEANPNTSEGAVASELDRKARLHFQQGTALFESGEYERAAEDFTEAYRLSNRPALLFNIALAHERLGQLKKAAELLRAYLAAVPDTPNRGRLELRIQRMEERAEAQLEEESRRARLAQEQAAQTAPVPTSQPKAEFNWRSPAVITTGAVTLGGLAALAIFGPLALVEKGDLENSCSPNCTDSDTSALRSYRLAADIGLGIAIVGAVGGTTWIVLDHRARSRNAQDRQARLLRSAPSGALALGTYAPAVQLGLGNATLRWRY